MSIVNASFLLVITAHSLSPQDKAAREEDNTLILVGYDLNTVSPLSPDAP